MKLKAPFMIPHRGFSSLEEGPTVTKLTTERAEGTWPPLYVGQKKILDQRTFNVKRHYNPDRLEFGGGTSSGVRRYYFSDIGKPVTK